VALHDSVEAGSQDAQDGCCLGNVPIGLGKYLLNCLAPRAFQGSVEPSRPLEPWRERPFLSFVSQVGFSRRHRPVRATQQRVTWVFRRDAAQLPISPKLS